MEPIEAIHALIRYRRKLERDNDSEFDAEPFDMAIEALEFLSNQVKNKGNRYVSREAILQAIKDAPNIGSLTYQVLFETIVESVPDADVVPWSSLERYADWFCASVSYPEFVREAKDFYVGTWGMRSGNKGEQ